MNTIIKLAQKLDRLGHYKLADKVAQVMDISQYADNPYTPKGVMDIRKMLVPTDFIGEVYQTQKGDTLIKTNDPRSFSIGLMEYARINKFPNLKAAFDDYANNGATFRGQSVRDVPELRELYLRISRTTTPLTKQMVEQELRNIITEKVGMTGWQKDSNQPANYQVDSYGKDNRQIDPNTGADLGYLANEYTQLINNQFDTNQLQYIKKEIMDDRYINQNIKNKLLEEVENKNNQLK